MKQKIIFAALFLAIMLGMNSAVMAYSIEFKFFSQNNSDDSATLTISNPLMSLDISSGACMPELITQAALNATGTWAESGLMPKVLSSSNYIGLTLERPAETWVPPSDPAKPWVLSNPWIPLLLYLQLFNEPKSTLDPDSNTPVAGVMGVGGAMLIALGAGNESQSFILYPDSDPEKAGIYNLYDGNNIDLKMPMYASINVYPAPLPPSLLLLAPGILGLGVMKRFQKKL
ncbi:MAG: hypothetical protein NT010_06635 [Proteobacteria bacterium]|nr:hypothetical protein [Pseudomonadota bacterium]